MVLAVFWQVGNKKADQLEHSYPILYSFNRFSLNVSINTGILHSPRVAYGYRIEMDVDFQFPVTVGQCGAWAFEPFCHLSQHNA